MKILTEQKQIETLRKKCDKVKNRIWIAVPFIGALSDVHKIIGDRWQLSKVDFRLLTDAELGFMGQGCFDAFKNAGIIKSLKGLHAKIYIVDDWCLVTSANLTQAAFSKRFEMGIESDACDNVVEQFEKWWEMAKVVSVAPKKKKSTVDDYEDGANLNIMFKLPKYSNVDKVDYESTCSKYDDFAQIYASVVPRDNVFAKAGYSLYKEVDIFLNFLFHDHPDTPSQNNDGVRLLSKKVIESEIRKYYKQMVNHYDVEELSWRLDRDKKLHELLSLKKISKITMDDVNEVVRCLHCYRSLPINIARFKNNNAIEDIRDCWNKLLFSGDITNEVIHQAENTLKYFGYSAVRELVGWYYPDKYPIINSNSLAGLRFFGYDVK